MKRCAQGFILLEAMLYSSLFIFLSIVSMAYVVDCYMRICKLLQLQTGSAKLSATLDVLVRDISQAPLQKSLWKCVTETEHIWTTEQGDIGFAHTNLGIVRSQGLFDVKKQRWIERTRSFFAADIRYHLQPIREDENCFYLMHLTLVSPRHISVSTTVALRSGILL